MMTGNGQCESVVPAAVAWSLLCRPTVAATGVSVDLKQRPEAVLLCLLLEPNRTVSVDKIAKFLWGENLPRTASNSVARFVADLRKVLGVHRGRIVTADGGYRVVTYPGELDVERADSLLAEADRVVVVDAQRSLGLVSEALDLVGTTKNAALTDLPFVDGAIRAHDELRIETVERYAEVALQLGRSREVVAHLERALDTYSYHEGLWLQLMLALAQSGRQAEALRVGQRSRQALAEIGLEPSSAFLAHESEVAIANRPPPAGSQASGSQPIAQSLDTHGIGEPTTRLVGRLLELRQLETALAVHRVVSIVGLGGCGKTRVATALGRSQEAAGHAVYRVGLRATNEALVLPMVAAVLGVPSGGALTSADLARSVAGDEFVLLLDNCEHVTDICAEIISALGQHAPLARVLATSRLPLRVASEYVFPLGNLEMPAADAESAESASVSLLIDRAEVHLRTSAPADHPLRHLCTIARLLGGHPLALEVAAAQLAYLDLPGLAERLAASFVSPAHAEHQTVNALLGVMDWTWAQLDPDDQILLARVAVFEGGWSLASARGVCGDDGGLDVSMSNLEARGLITQATVNGQARYDMLEPARGYALERLAERNERNAMCERLVRWLQGLVNQWSIAEHHAWAKPGAVLYAEHGNLAAALSYLDRHDRRAEFADLAIKSSGMWVNYGFADQIERWLRPIYQDESNTREIRSAAAAMLLSASHALGELDDLNDLGAHAIELADDKPHDWVPAVAGFLSLWGLFSPGTMSSDQLHELSMSAAEQSTSQATNLAIARLYQAHVQFCLRQYDEAASLFGDIRRDVDQVGRVLLVAEVGHALALLLAERTQDALASVSSWRSQHDSDDWHYMVEIVRAVVVGGCGQPAQATSDLAAAVRRLLPASVWGRADEIQTSFGLLAGFGGDQTLAYELLSTVQSRDVLLTVAAIELSARWRSIDDDAGWLGVAEEFWSRVVPEDGARLVADTAPELVSFWHGGSAVS
jgi:predicted ATPase/DNA-binding SARP family transcriptional activator